MVEPAGWRGVVEVDSRRYCCARGPRRSQKVAVADVKGLNTLLKWIKRLLFCARWSKMEPPVCLCGIAEFGPSSS
eukprot:3882303-Pyramimonas_sp.AAC.1